MSCYGYRKLSTAQGAKDFAEYKVDEYDEYLQEEWDYYLEDMVKSFSKTLGAPFNDLFPMVIQKYLDEYKGDYDAVELSEYLKETADMLESGGSPYIADGFRNFAEYLEEFEVKDEETWLTDEYEGTLGDLADHCYDEYRDRQMGL